MVLSLSISSEAEARLQERARASGQDVPQFVQQLIANELKRESSTSNAAIQLAAIESFISGMTDWVSKNIPAGHFAEDDRERLYEGRGE